MKTNGLFIGKFLPFHRGHLCAILKASTQCDNLYIVVSQNRNFMRERCTVHNIKEMPLEMITMWIKKELQNFSDHITVVQVDETDIPPMEGPGKWRPEWAVLAKKALINGGMKELLGGEVDLDFMFGSEIGYEQYVKDYFNKDAIYKTIDLKREYIDISATRLVKNIYENWDMLPGSVRPHFTKKVLITGIESCGKTTISQKLAKNFLTSWSEEYGKWYQKNEMGDYEGNWRVEDFETIAMRQLEQDSHAYKTANKVAFIDTDAIITDYYLELFIGKGGQSQLLETLKQQEVGKWDLVFLLQPTVPWVQDGTRFDNMKEQKIRWELHRKLKSMYDSYGIKYIEIGGDYKYRFETIISIVEELLEGK
jgi:HTH-type transcriptional regulator, transcriptional repressor of NAD biosynthesis genes